MAWIGDRPSRSLHALSIQIKLIEDLGGNLALSVDHNDDHIGVSGTAVL
jgi:hypothetical protein